MPVEAARADAASILSDLRHLTSDVPGAEVSLGPATSEEQSWGYTGQMLRVTMALPQGAPLAGILAAPGNVYTRTTPSIPLWDAAVMAAAKHEVRRGGSVQGVVVTRKFAGAPAPPGPEMLFGLQGLQPPASSTLAMTEDEVASAVRAGLPPWATAGAIEVANDAGQERVVKLSLVLAPLLLRAADPDAALQALLDVQETLAPGGARIGRSIVQIIDATSGDPLYSAAGDVEIGFASVWRSPLIAGFAGPPETP